MSITRVVAITGCDSGLGWAIAARSAREGLVTIAGMYQGTDTKAAEALRKLQAHPYALDVTSMESVARFQGYVNGLLKDNPGYKLHAVVNNAGVMTIGNFEWQTPDMVHNMINVNLLGAMRVASAFLPELRKSAAEDRLCVACQYVISSFIFIKDFEPLMSHKPLLILLDYTNLRVYTETIDNEILKSESRRLMTMLMRRLYEKSMRDILVDVLRNTTASKPRLINVASHCGLQPLPGFGAYSASKAGLIAWTKALRLEYRDHEITALAFVPGGFVSSSNIIANQTAQGRAMIENLSEEQKFVYEKHITSLTKYLGSGSPRDTRYDSLRDENIIETFMKALSDDDPKELYKVESWRYMFYYNLLKLPLPETTHHWFVKKFISFPETQ